MFLESQNLAITRTELDDVFFQKFSYDATTPGIATARSGSLFREVPTTHSAYIFEVSSETGLWPKIGEVQTVPSSTPKVTNKMTVAVADFANSIRISKNLFDDAMFNVWGRNVEKFALKARVTQDQNAFRVFRNAFTTELTPDGVSIVNAAHPLIQGGTTSNIITGALDDNTLNDALVALRQQVDQSGVVLGGQGSILVVPSKLAKKAWQLTDSVLTPESANNAVNIYRSLMGITVMSSPYLDAIAGGSDTAWFLLTADHSICRLVRQGMQTALTDWTYSTDRTYNYQGNFREEVFVEDYSGIVGSLGA